MSEPQRVDAAALQARIAALRDAAARLDPVRLQYLESLAARVQEHGDAVRELLCDKLAAAVAACEQRCAVPAATPPRKKAGPSAPAPLVALNQYIRTTTARGKAAPGEQSAASGELQSVRRFRRAWLGTRTQEEVQQAVGRRPANAGPLNSHALVLESLAIMSRLSPDYLRRFVAHVQALQWLDQASVEDAPPAKAASRADKASRRAVRRK